MSNFSPKLQDSTEDELLHMINELNPTFTILASDELTRRVLRKLQKTIEISNKHSEKLEIANYKLQITMVVLTTIGTLAVTFPVLKTIFQWLSVSVIDISITNINILSATLSVILAIATLLKIRNLNDKEIRRLVKKYKEFLP